MAAFLNYLPLILGLVMIFMGLPVAISLFTSALIYFAFITDMMPLTMLVQRMVSSAMSLSMLACPLYLLIGCIMERSLLGNKLMGFCNALVGHKKGGLGHVNVLLSTLDGGICGSSTADVAMQCKILVPEMTKQGYPVPFSAAVTAASGLISPIIPPGAQLIMYGIITGTSIGRMFMAGYIPGIIMCVAEMVVVGIMAKKLNLPRGRDNRASFKEIIVAFKESFWALFIALLLLVGLRLGLFTVTEGATVLTFLCLIVGLFIYKTMNFRDLKPIFISALHTTGSIMLMITSSMAFGLYLSWAGIPQALAKAVLSFTTSKVAFLALTTILLFIAGMFLNGNAVMMIMAPMLFPISQAFGVDPVLFGIIMIVNTSIGSLTPPVGGCMYVACNMLDVSIPDFQKAVWPFIVAMLLELLLFILFPQIVTFLPNLMLG